MEYILKTNNLKKSYGKSMVLNGINMNVLKGSIYGFVGKNGAGKTTLIRIICGLQEASSGTYEIYNIKNSNKEILKVRKRMGAVVESPSIYVDMTAKENIIYQYKIIGLPSYDGIDDLLKLVGLNKAQNKKVKNFSLGMKQRLAIAISLAGNPDFIVLDEPINGLDPQGIIEMRELILKLNKEYGITVLISSHILDELSKLASHYGFIDKGIIVNEMSSEELFKKFKKSIRLEVSNIEKLSLTLDKLNLDYKILSDKSADIYSEIEITKLINELSYNDCTVYKIWENDQSLEAYYMNLVGGKLND